MCAAVASGGRARLTEESAFLLVALLKGARRQSLRERRSALNADDTNFIAEANRSLKTIDATIEEIERAQIEKGWPTHGQLLRPHT